MGKNPQPAYDNSASNRSAAILKTFSPRNGSPRQSFDTCAYCHGNKKNVFVGFRAGDRYEDYAIPFLISAPIPRTIFRASSGPTDGRIDSIARRR